MELGFVLYFKFVRYGCFALYKIKVVGAKYRRLSPTFLLKKKR